MPQVDLADPDTADSEDEGVEECAIEDAEISSSKKAKESQMISNLFAEEQEHITITFVNFFFNSY